MHEFTNEEIAKIINLWTIQLDTLPKLKNEYPTKYPLYDIKENIIGKELDTWV